MQEIDYLMESAEEVLRLDVKTESTVVEGQALWAGIRPGMSVADIGFGSGKTSAILHSLVQPGGSVLGVDGSGERTAYATSRYGDRGIRFVSRDIRNSLDDLGRFDFVWVRFVLEYYRAECIEIVQSISRIVKPGGILCLIDLDHNSLNHFRIPQKLEATLNRIIERLQSRHNCDLYAGRKLYSCLYDLGYQDIDVSVSAHHLIFGELQKKDAFNWMKKIEVIVSRMNDLFDEYDDGFEGFVREFEAFFSDPGRFTYTPVICCRGRRPDSGIQG